LWVQRTKGTLCPYHKEVQHTYFRCCRRFQSALWLSRSDEKVDHAEQRKPRRSPYPDLEHMIACKRYLSANYVNLSYTTSPCFSFIPGYGFNRRVNMTIKPPARGYRLAIPEHIQVLIADSFRSINFAAPLNQPINRTISSSTRWVPAPHPPTRKGFAEGSEGLVNLWCLLDGDQKITDRIVVKQVHPGATRYNDPLNWKDGAVGGEPRECAMANAVWPALPVAHKKHVLECLGWGDCKGEPR
jgi:hypothetical protein